MNNVTQLINEIDGRLKRKRPLMRKSKSRSRFRSRTRSKKSNTFSQSYYGGKKRKSVRR